MNHQYIYFASAFLLFSTVSLGGKSNIVARVFGYNSYQNNPDGTKVCGGAYNSYQVNPDGTKVCGGAYDSYQVNPDGTKV